MIRINKQFSMERDKDCWILRETKIGKDQKTGENKKTFKQTYHGSIKQISKAILNKSSESCSTIDELKDLYENAVDKLTEVLKEKVEPKRRRRRNQE